jgi:hypothetical protein
LLICVCIIVGLVSKVAMGISLKDVVESVICSEGDLHRGHDLLSQEHRNSAGGLHSLAALEVILHANITGATSLFRLAKSLSATTIPPLAQLHLNGNSCGGIGDLYYIAAVIIKQMIDSNIDPQGWQEALTTLITLSADSGLHREADGLWQEALSLAPDSPSLLFRGPLLTPAVYESTVHVVATREKLMERVKTLFLSRNSLSLKSLDEFVLSPTFYLIYQGYNDRRFLEMLQASYIAAYPLMVANNDEFSLTRQTDELQEPVVTKTTKKRLRVGFVSSYYRRHSICKLFCGVTTRFNPQEFEVFLFSSLPSDREDEMTKALRVHSRNASNHFHYISIGKTLVHNREEVLNRHIDILVYLDVGMEPSTTVWAASRLAPIQVH